MPASQLSDVTLSSAWRLSLAALFSSTRIGPKAAWTWRVAATRAAVSVRSAATKSGGVAYFASEQRLQAEVEKAIEAAVESFNGGT